MAKAHNYSRLKTFSTQTLNFLSLYLCPPGEVQNTSQRWQSKDITHDKKKSQHQQRQTFMAHYNSPLSAPLQTASQ